MSKILTLNNASQTKKEDEIKRTVYQPKVTTKVDASTNGFYNDDGTPNAMAQQYYDQAKNEVADANGIDPETGKVKPQYLTDILGVDPEVMRRKREEEAALNRRKQKESGLYNAIAVLGDMITTAGGGNVYKRDADRHAAKAHDANMALDREQQAEDIANANKVRATENAYAAAVQKLRDSVARQFGSKISRTMEQGGGSITTTSGGGTKTTGWKQEQERLRNSVNVNTGSGSGKGSVDIGVIKGNGDLGTRSVPQEKAKNLLAHAEYVYENAIKGGGHDALLKHFKQSGIIKDVKYKDNDEEKGIVEKIDWNEERLQRSGYLMWGGGDENLDRTIKNYYYEITGSDNPIVPVTGGHGRLSGNKTNVRKKTR